GAGPRRDLACRRTRPRRGAAHAVARSLDGRSARRLEPSLGRGVSNRVPDHPFAGFHPIWPGVLLGHSRVLLLGVPEVERSVEHATTIDARMRGYVAIDGKQKVGIDRHTDLR